MLDYLFVYGSLMPHLAGPFGAEQRARLARESTVIGPAQVAATLYDLGDYPGLIEAVGPATVQGVLLRLKDPRTTFAWLDPFEDIEEDAPEAVGIYERCVLNCRMSSAHAADEQAFEAWVYVMRRVPPGAKCIASGIWHAPSP